MSGVKKYYPVAYNYDGFMEWEEDEQDGEWVKFEDHKALIEEFEKRINELTADKINLRSENMELETKLAKAVKPDHAGRVWMHCEKGLSMTKASMARFVMFCLRNNIEIGVIHPFNPNYDRCQVSASVRLKPEQIEAFEAETGGKLRKPPRISLNTSSPADTLAELKGDNQ